MTVTHSTFFRSTGRFGYAVLLSALLAVGCDDQDSAITTEMHEDFDHDHKHQHTGKDDHEHEHKDKFEGSHSHGHSHSHRHGEPLHGGRVVSIGHTHHKDGAMHFHAEVMPLDDNAIRVHLLTEADDGTSKDYEVDVPEIPALISIKGQELGARECSFVAVGGGATASEFSMQIPEPVREGEEFQVVIPRLVLSGHRQNFSFAVSRKREELEAEAVDPARESSDE